MSSTKQTDASTGTLDGSLEELGSRLVALWVINRQRDSAGLLKQFMSAIPRAEVRVVRNGYFGDEKKLELYNASKVRQTVEDRGGKSITLPELADRVAPIAVAWAAASTRRQSERETSWQKCAYGSPPTTALGRPLSAPLGDRDAASRRRRRIRMRPPEPRRLVSGRLLGRPPDHLAGRLRRATGLGPIAVTSLTEASSVSGSPSWRSCSRFIAKESPGSFTGSSPGRSKLAIEATASHDESRHRNPTVTSGRLHSPSTGSLTGLQGVTSTSGRAAAMSVPESATGFGVVNMPRTWQRLSCAPV